MEFQPQIDILAEGLLFPEGPVWLSDGSVAFVEIGRGTVSRWTPDGGVSVVAQTGGGPNGLAVGPDGAFYVCNSGGFRFVHEGGYYRPVGTAPDYAGGRIERIDPATGKVERLYERCGEHGLKGPNDLVFDGRGGFYFTDTGRVRERDRDNGGVYYALADGSKIVEAAYPLLTPNGIGLSPDGRTLYVAEMEPARLWAYDVLEPGVLARQPFPVANGGRLIIGLGGFQRLDSLAVTASGNICLATLVTGCVTIVSPQGELLGRVKTPDIYCTNICFGGEDVRTAFLTLGLTGKLARCRWHEAGLRLAHEI